MAYAFETLQVVVDDGVAVVTLNSPESMNALGNTMIREVGTAFQQLRHDPEVKVVVLTGAGKAFCAGGDVKGMADGSLKVDYFSGRREIGRMCLAIYDIEKPVICAVNGVAAGGGAGLVLACDLVYASEKAAFSVIHAAVGMVPDCGCMWLLPRIVGPNKAKKLCWTAEIIDAKEMHRLGIAEELVPADELMPTALAFAKKLSKSAMRSLSLSNNIMNDSADMSFKNFLDLEAFAIESVMASHDLKEGMAAFVEKRKPVFTGE